MKACRELSQHSCCQSFDQRQNLVLREKRSIYLLQNPSQKTLLHLTVDGCLIAQHEGSKCDGLIAICEDQKLVLVELKGSDVKKAVMQIDATLDHSVIRPYLKETRAFGRIVASKAPTPALRSSEYRKLEKRFAGLNGNLKTGTQQMTEQA